MVVAPHPLEFFGRLSWLDGKPLQIEEYRREIFTRALYSFDDRGNPQYNMVVNGRAKKNYKTTDLILAAFYRFLAWPSAHGNDIFIVANDEDQAADDLDLAKKLIRSNPLVSAEVAIMSKEIVRKDGRGRMRILPAQDAVGVHGKTYLMVGFDEIWGYRDYALIEGLAPDPSRRDVLSWITSYAPLQNKIGVPLVDYIAAGKKGDDSRLFFSWYSGDYCTEAGLDGLTPEEKANPSAASWGDGGEYLRTQKMRLPVHRYRRLHLNLPGLQDAAAFDPEAVLSSVVPGRKRVPYVLGQPYVAFVDMSGGSNDDATLAVAHWNPDDRRVIVDLIVSQTGSPPFNPRHAVQKFVGILKEYRISRVRGDRYAGLTFRADFEEHGIGYDVADMTAPDIYAAFEPKLNAGEIELPDHTKSVEQFLGLVIRGAGKIQHLPGDHDDFANAVAGAVVYCQGDENQFMRIARIVEAREEEEALQREAAERAQVEFAESEARAAVLAAEQCGDSENTVWIKFPKNICVAYRPNHAFPGDIQQYMFVPGISPMLRRAWEQNEQYLRGSGATRVNEEL